MKKALALFVVSFSLGILLTRPHAEAAKTVTFQAVINQGVLLADIRDQQGQTIPNPALDLGRVVNSFECRTTEHALSGALGSQTQRIYVDNPRAAFDGWTLTIATEAGTEATWSGG